MKATEYLKDRLTEIINLFPGMTFKYQYDHDNLTHIIEVEPLEIYENNIDYVNQEANLINDFEIKFELETILFISEKSLSKITKPDFVLNSSYYQKFRAVDCKFDVLNIKNNLIKFFDTDYNSMPISFYNENLISEVWEMYFIIKPNNLQQFAQVRNLSDIDISRQSGKTSFTNLDISYSLAA